MFIPSSTRCFLAFVFFRYRYECHDSAEVEKINISVRESESVGKLYQE